MYQNRIRRTPVNRNPQSYSRHADIAYDQRMAFLESVCAALNESRFGTGGFLPFVPKLSDRPEIEPADFFDGSDDKSFPSYALSPLGRGRNPVVKATGRNASRIGISGTHPNDHGSDFPLSSNLGRGSPDWRASIPACLSAKHEYVIN